MEIAAAARLQPCASPPVPYRFHRRTHIRPGLPVRVTLWKPLFHARLAAVSRQEPENLIVMLISLLRSLHTNNTQPEIRT